MSTTRPTAVGYRLRIDGTVMSQTVPTLADAQDVAAGAAHTGSAVTVSVLLDDGTTRTVQRYTPGNTIPLPV